ncbi:MAG: hypothetical protein CVU39_28255 [Chloroflexi bacterium HGW-Chloroflexi-10]|nr:MAG: hypothetical protein CVU39_28255 [Chloroflexi bacterium HGW-Chloroflexi-10]
MIRMKIILLLLMCCGFVSTSCSFVSILRGFDLLKPPMHSLEENDEYEVIWNIENIYIPNNRNNPSLIGVPGKIIIQTPKALFTQSLIAYDSLNGEKLWESDLGFFEYGMIAAHEDRIFRGTGGTASVSMYDPETGKRMWKTHFITGHSATDIYLNEDEVYVYTNNSQFYVVDLQGKVIKRRYYVSFRTFLAEDNLAYKETDFTINAKDLNTNNEIWSVDLESAIVGSPVFDNGTIFLETSSGKDWLYSIDQITGELNWKKSFQLISNFVVLKDTVHFIDSDGYLIALDRSTGEEISKIGFTEPFDLDQYYNGYFLAADRENQMLAIYFADNKQIMGVKMK